MTYLDIPTFLLANIIVDVEPILVISLKLDYPLHGFLHSFLGGTMVAVILALIMNGIRSRFSSLLKFFKIEQDSSFGNILLASFSGIYIHILLDSTMHLDIRPFYPLDFNPFLLRSMMVGVEIYMLCIWSFILGVVVYGIRLFLIWIRSHTKIQIMS